MKRKEAGNLQPILAVFFDAGGTLFRPYPSVGGVYARLALKHGCRVSARWVEERFRAQWRRRGGLGPLTTEAGEKNWWRRLVRGVFGGRMPEDRFERYFRELYDLFARPSVWRLFPDALPALKTLRKKGLLLGIVSNWDSRLFRVCRGLGVSPRVNFILASAVEGSAKPRAGLFREALKRAGVRPDQALHVGDNYREDYWGARKAGLKALLLDRRGRSLPSATGRGGASAVRIRSLKEVWPRLKALPTRRRTR